MYFTASNPICSRMLGVRVSRARLETAWGKVAEQLETHDSFSGWLSRCFLSHKVLLTMLVGYSVVIGRAK